MTEMELGNGVGELEPWGITSFDCSFTGLPRQVFNLVRTCNKEVSMSAVGHYLKEGIDHGQRVVLTGFDHADHLLAKFKEYGFNFYDDLLSEQLIYLYYKPVFSYSISFATNYLKLIEEIKILSKGDFGRIAFLNADALFNLETYLLAEVSAENILSSFSNNCCAVLGCYVANDSLAHRNLDEISKTFLSSYIEISATGKKNRKKYNLILHKSPLVYEINSLKLYLTPALGFNTRKLGLISHG